MSTTIPVARSMWEPIAHTTPKASIRFSFLIIMAGQPIFAVRISIFYGLKAWRGDLSAWNGIMTPSYVARQDIGNTIVGVHIGSAVIILIAGTFQFIPAIRAHAPALHRWTGWLYILSACTISVAGLYTMWFRGTVGDLSQHLGISGLAVFIILCATMAVRQARDRQFESHRRCAIRLFIVVSASLFIRATILLKTMIAGHPFGFDPVTSTGPLLTFNGFAQYLLPLALFEIYLRGRTAGPAIRTAMAAGLLVITLTTAAGLAAVTATIWLPDIMAGLDACRSITGVISASIAAGGIERAIAQYHALKASQSAVYDFDEPELNSLDYTILPVARFGDAIRIFQLNVKQADAVQCVVSPGGVSDSVARTTSASTSALA